MKILIVDDEPGICMFLQEATKRQGHAVEYVHDGTAALARLMAEPFDLLLTDVQMPGMDGFALLSAAHALQPDMIAVIMTGHGTEECAIRALRLGANNYLQKPIRYKELQILLAKYQDSIMLRSLDRHVTLLVTRKTVALTLDNTLPLVSRVADFLVREAGDTIAGADRMAIKLGVVELLVNAIEHGNLEISYAEKMAALETADGMTPLYQDRLNRAELARRRVAIDFCADAATLTWTICDGGAGFDWRHVISPLDNGHLGQLCGRGIFLCRMNFDEVRYNDAGNSVQAIKRRATAPA